MDNNEYMRRIRYALKLDDAESMRLIKLGGVHASLAQTKAWRCKEGDEDFESCPDSAIGAFLDGLILDRRGPPPAHAAAKQASGESALTARLDNNAVLKQLRIALSLRTEDIHSLLVAGGGRLGKAEVNALFRSPEARNYRSCGDQVMRCVLSGLAARRDES